MKKLTREERIKSVETTRLKHLFERSDKVCFSKKELATIILDEVDYACDLIDAHSIEDVE